MSKKKERTDRTTELERENAELRAELEKARGVNGRLVEMMTTSDHERGQMLQAAMIAAFRAHMENAGSLGVYARQTNTRGKVIFLHHILGLFVEAGWHDEMVRLTVDAIATQVTIHALFFLAEGQRRANPVLLSKLLGKVNDVGGQLISFLYRHGLTDDDPAVQRARQRFNDHAEALHTAMEGDFFRLEAVAAQHPLDWIDEWLTDTAKIPTRGGVSDYVRWAGEIVAQGRADGLRTDEIAREMRSQLARLREIDRDRWEKIQPKIEPVLNRLYENRKAVGDRFRAWQDQFEKKGRTF
jgi:hypothetical protein